MTPAELGDMANQALAQANEIRGEQRQRLLLRSARLFYYKHDLKSAGKILDSMKPDAAIMGETRLLAARVALAENNPEKAITLLPPTGSLRQSRQLQAKILLADIDAALGYSMRAVKTRVELETQFDTADARLKNNEQIWTVLSSMSATALEQETSTDPGILAWLDLARIMRNFSSQGQRNINKVENAVLDWGTRHPQQPVSNIFLSHLIDDYTATAIKVKRIAVLLPQQGKFAGAAVTIQNGLLSAYYTDDDATTRPTLKFYDTADPNVSFSQLLQQAIDDGATNIIGPLDKTLISKLEQQHDLPIPVLTLNYSNNPQMQTNNLFQFGLSPEDEARQVAELAIRQGKQKVVILAPDNNWGRRIQNAFSAYFEQLGGNVIATQDYSSTSADFSRPIRRLFNLDQSTMRYHRIQDTLGEKLKFMPYRRHDVDMIFIAATPRSARGIVPSLRFHHAGALPVYATSSVYTGTPDVSRDNDLDGLLFCDMPWILENSKSDSKMAENMNRLKQIFKTNWPDQQRYTRLFALGVDAYHLLFNLQYLHENNFARFSGATGNIQLDKNGRIIRHLLWARFINGRAVYIKPEIKIEALPMQKDGIISSTDNTVTPVIKSVQPAPMQH